MEDKSMENIDLYDLLGLTINASLKQIKSAFRKKSLEYHPDKNPDNPKAAELFHNLSKALKILTDDKARADYDKILRAKEAAKLRHKELDATRRKFKEELEQREAAAKLDTLKRKSSEEKLNEKMQRLEKEGKKLLKEELERRVKVNEKCSVIEDGSDYKLKILWDKNKDSYDEKTLRKIFSKYGDINALVLSGKKPTAIVEFTTKDAAVTAHQLEKGLSRNALSILWVDKRRNEGGLKIESQRVFGSSSDVDEFEKIVLQNMKMAQEKKKSLEQND